MMLSISTLISSLRFDDGVVNRFAFLLVIHLAFLRKNGMIRFATLRAMGGLTLLLVSNKEIV